MEEIEGYAIQGAVEDVIGFNRNAVQQIVNGQAPLGTAGKLAMRYNINHDKLTKKYRNFWPFR